MATLLELLDKLWNQDNKLALQAVEEMRARGWLSDGSLRGVALCRVNLEGADLMKADLCNVDLHQAHLEFADLSMANLSASKLTRANLHGANLSHTNLTRADLYKANLRSVRNLTDEQLCRVTRLWGATMPDGNTYDGRFNLAGDLELARWSSINTNDPKAMADFFRVSLETYLAGQEQAVKITS